MYITFLLLESEFLLLKWCFGCIRIVRSYLQHYGYEETLNAFDAAGQTSVPPVSFHNHGSFDTYALNHRKILRKVLSSCYIFSFH